MTTTKVMPKISVIITCYNYANYVEEAIESVLSQTYKNVELIIIDDGSTDNSLDVINKHKETATVISRENKGIVYTRNQGLKIAQGKYIVFLDADDYFNEDYIKKSLIIAEKTNADVVIPNWRLFGDTNTVTNFPEFSLKKLVRQEIHCTSESLIRKNAIGNHKFESNIVAEDWDFFLGLALDGRKLKLAKDNFINYRVQHGSRGNSRPYWEDMYYFCEILSKWDKRFPGKINPFELPISVGARESKRVDDLDKLLKGKDTLIELKERDLEQARKKILEIQHSKSYMLASKLIKPVSYLKSKVKKRR